MHINAHAHAFPPVDMCAHNNKFVPTKMRPKGETKIFKIILTNLFFKFCFQWFNGISMVICSQESISRLFNDFMTFSVNFCTLPTDRWTD